MRMTFTELARVTRPPFAVVTWPVLSETIDVDEAVSQLLSAAEQLIAGRQGTLIDRVLGIVSSRPGDFVLARLLACYGPRVHFVCPAAPTWNPAFLGPLFQRLSARLEKEHPDLDLSQLRDVAGHNYKQSERFYLEARSVIGTGDPLANRCHVVFAIDVLDASLARSVQTLERLAGVTRVGGTVELFGEARTAASSAVLEQLVQQTGLLGLGIASAARPVEWPGTWRLSLRRLGEATFEFPRAAEDSPALLAHCQARLRFAAQFTRGADVLEAGCGTGLGARLFLDHGASHIVGLDYSREALRRARTETADARAEFREWDLNRTPLPLDDACVDLVVCLEVLEHLHNQEALIAEFLRVLRPGGRLIVSVPDQRFEEQWIRCNRFRNIYHVRVPGRAELARLLEPFAEVRLARQADFVGSVVTQDGTDGSFRFQPGEVDRDTAVALVAVCVKAPLESARSVSPAAPQMFLYSNYQTGQLAAQRQVQQLEEELDEERRRRWVAENRLAREDYSAPLDSRSLPTWSADRAARAWIHGDSEAYLLTPAEPGAWSARLAEELAAAEAVPPPGDIPSGPWLLEVDGPSFRLSPLESAPAGATAVFFPLPEWRIGFGRLWRWDRSGVKEVWFREAGGWKQCDLRAVVARRLFDWITRRTLFGAARWLGLHRPKTQARVMLTAMRLFRRDGLPEVRHRSLDVPDEALWPEWIAGSDRHRCVARRPLKIAQYTWSLSPGGTERQVCNLAAGLARRGASVRVLTTEPHVEEFGHYAKLLRSARVPARTVSRAALPARRWIFPGTCFAPCRGNSAGRSSI